MGHWKLVPDDKMGVWQEIRTLFSAGMLQTLPATLPPSSSKRNMLWAIQPTAWQLQRSNPARGDNKHYFVHVSCTLHGRLRSLLQLEGRTDIWRGRSR